MTKEVGSLSDARKMPIEIRRWWLEQMRKELEELRNQQNGGR